MDGQTDRHDRWFRALRRTAWIWSAGSVALVVAFILGEGGPCNTNEWIGFLFFPLGICAGIILAWWREALGGALTVASLLAF